MPSQTCNARACQVGRARFPYNQSFPDELVSFVAVPLLEAVDTCVIVISAICIQSRVGVDSPEISDHYTETIYHVHREFTVKVHFLYPVLFITHSAHGDLKRSLPGQEKTEQRCLRCHCVDFADEPQLCSEFALPEVLLNTGHCKILQGSHGPLLRQFVQIKIDFVDGFAKLNRYRRKGTTIEPRREQIKSLSFLPEQEEPALGSFVVLVIEDGVEVWRKVAHELCMPMIPLSLWADVDVDHLIRQESMTLLVQSLLESLVTPFFQTYSLSGMSSLAAISRSSTCWRKMLL